MGSVSYQLRAQYVGNYGGGTIAYGPYATSFDVGAALAAGGGTIVATDEALVHELDRYPPLYRSSYTGDPTPTIAPRFRALSTGNGLTPTDIAYETRLNNEPYPRWQMLGDGSEFVGSGSVAPTELPDPFAAESRGAATSSPWNGVYLGNATQSEYDGEGNMPIQGVVYFGNAGGQPLTGRPQAYRFLAKYFGPTTADTAQGGSTQAILVDSGTPYTQTLPACGDESDLIVQGANVLTGKGVGHSFAVQAHNTAVIKQALVLYLANIAAKDAGTVVKEWVGLYAEDVDIGSAGAVPNREALHTKVGVHVEDALCFATLTGVKGHLNASASIGATSVTLESGEGAAFSNGQSVVIGVGTNAEVRTVAGLSGDTFNVTALSKAHDRYCLVQVYDSKGFANLYMSSGVLVSDTNFQPPAVNPGQVNVRFTNGAGYMQMGAQSGGTVATPSAGNLRTYPNTNKVWSIKNEDGVEAPIFTGHRRTINTNTTLSALDAGIIARSSLATAVTFTLPAANGVPAGTMFTFVDEAGDASTSNITIQRAGTDDISEGATVGSSKVITTNGGVKRLYTTGGTRWYVV